MLQLRPFYENVQTIYDIDHSPEFLSLFLDPAMVYSCAYFERDDMTLEEAQVAKLDLSLDKCGLRPGQRLLEVGCGYGACARRAATKYGADVVALTLSHKQRKHVRDSLDDLPEGSGRIDVRLQGWEQFDEPVDRIISIAAFEAFRYERYAPFFERCRKLLPSDGRMLLHTIVWHSPRTLERLGIPLTHDDVLFGKFIRREVFPGGMLCDPETIVRRAEAAGFRIARIHSLQKHYARTLETWAANLEENREEAIDMASESVYDRYMRYLAGCAKYYRSGHLDLMQFTLAVK